MRCGQCDGRHLCTQPISGLSMICSCPAVWFVVHGDMVLACMCCSACAFEDICTHYVLSTYVHPSTVSVFLQFVLLRMYKRTYIHPSTLSVFVQFVLLRMYTYVHTYTPALSVSWHSSAKTLTVCGFKSTRYIQ